MQNRIIVYYGVYRESARIIEKIIGQDKMINLYFLGDLKGLVSEMPKFSSEKEIKKFIVNLYNNNFNNIFFYLNNLFFNKLNNDLQNEKITILKAKEKTKEFRESIIRMHETIINLRKIEVQQMTAGEIYTYENQKRRSRGNIAISILYILNIVVTLLLYLCIFKYIK